MTADATRIDSPLRRANEQQVRADLRYLGGRATRTRQTAIAPARRRRPRPTGRLFPALHGSRGIAYPRG